MSTVIADVMTMLCTRATCRSFTADEVPDHLLNRIVGAATCAPTSFGLQPYSFVVVRDAERRARLASLAGGQPHVRDAPVAIVVCADLRRVEHLTGVAGLLDAGCGDALLNSVIDASLAGMCLALAAESMGLGTVMVGGVRNEPESVVRLLALPPGVYALFGVSLGWPKGQPMVQARLAERLIVHRERYVPNHTSADGADLNSEVRGKTSPEQLLSWSVQIRRAGEKFRQRRPLPWRAGGGTGPR